MEMPVRDLTGKEVDSIDLMDSVFGVEMHGGAVHQALVRQRANSRQGTHSTKTRSQVSGSTRKPFAQKHTGRARAGQRRSPLWRHGGVVFGPHPRSYRQDIPKKMRILAIRCMLSDKHRTGSLIILRDLDLKDGKTKEITAILRALNVTDSTLVVTKEANGNVTRSARNVGWVKTIPAALLNVGDLLKYHHLIITVDGARLAEQIWSRDIDRKRVLVQASPPDQLSESEAKPARSPRSRGPKLKAEASPGQVAKLEQFEKSDVSKSVDESSDASAEAQKDQPKPRPTRSRKATP